MSCSDYSTVTQEMQAFLDEKLPELAARVERKNQTADRYQSAMTESQFRAFKECGRYITADEKGHIIGANFCKNRFCPVCNKRYSSAKWHYIKSIATAVNTAIAPNWALFTVTVRNCPSEQLKQTIDDLMSAINRMNSTNTWKHRVIGFFRSLETTYNSDRHDYHPHYHILLCLPSDYYTNPDLYLSTAEWRQLWERSVRADYTCQIDLSPINGYGDELSSAIAEVAKYAVKLSSVVEQGSEALKPLAAALRRRRLISYGGILKDSFAAVKTADKVQAEQNRANAKTQYIYELQNGNYTLSRVISD